MRWIQKLAVSAAAACATAYAASAVLRSRRRIDWADKAVLVTGGSRGLGLVLARRLASAGARVAICARDPAELLHAQAELARLTDREVLAPVCDVDEPDQIRKTVDDVARQFGRLDAVFNVAGRIEVGPLQNMSAEDFDRSIKTHFWAAFHTTMAAVPYLKSAGGGRIVNIASIGGKIAVPHLLPYSAGKFALVGFSEGVRAELLPHNIFVTTVCPGLIRTGSPRNADFTGQADREYAWFAAADVMPVQSISVDRIADRIIDAAAHGDAELILPLVASLQSKLHGLMPGVTAEILSLANRLLPGAGPGRRKVKGRQVGHLEPRWSRAANDQAAAENNE